MIRGTVLAEAPSADEDHGWHGSQLDPSSVGQTSPLAITFYESLGTCEDGGEPLVYGREPGGTGDRRGQLVHVDHQ